MNKFALMLGILLLAGLSFAQEWMGYVATRYVCSSYYNLGGYDRPIIPYAGLNFIANNYFNSDYRCFDYRAMDGYADAMNGEIWGKNSMCENSGCIGEESVSGLRSNMLSYNMDAAQFRALFLSGVRYCMSAYPREYPRETVLGWLNEAKMGYHLCLLENAGERGTCFDCDRFI
jgi:hypothetical protein